MRLFVLCSLVLVLALLPGVVSAAFPHELIVPGSGIGLFHLGMTSEEIQTVRKTALCAVAASFKEGKVIRLETNCGGAYRTAEWVQVGGAPSRAVWYYGDPSRVTPSDGVDYRADWLHYNGGISFRIIYGYYGSALIQAIAVFPGTGRLQVRNEPYPAAPSTPGVGE